MSFLWSKKPPFKKTTSSILTTFDVFLMVRNDTQRETSEVTAKSKEREGLGGKKS